MWGFLRRTTIPTILLLGGLAALVYGAAIRTVPVTEEQEVEKTIVIPAPFGPPGFGDPSGNPFAGPPGDGGFAGPDTPFAAEFTKKVKQKVIVTHEQREMGLTRDVIFGGVVRLESGELRRTYTGTPPSLCPT